MKIKTMVNYLLCKYITPFQILINILLGLFLIMNPTYYWIIFLMIYYNVIFLYLRKKICKKEALKIDRNKENKTLVEINRQLYIEYLLSVVIGTIVAFGVFYLIYNTFKSYLNLEYAVILFVFIGSTPLCVSNLNLIKNRLEVIGEDRIRIKDTLDKRNLFDGIIAFQFPVDIIESYYKKLEEKLNNKGK